MASRSAVGPLEAGDPDFVGPYRLLGRLGDGGMGVVFLGEDIGGELAAVKLIHPHFANRPHFRARFAREVEAARSIRAEVTARILDSDVSAVQPWVASEYVPGPTLADRVDSAGPLDYKQAQQLATGLVEALTAIHAAGVVHRDLKPTNIVLADDGPRVIDFGIAHMVDATSLTQTGDFLGTWSWSSPEQINRQPLGPASDVFSWGLVTAYAATGRHPYGDDHPVIVANRIATQNPDLRYVPPGLRPAVASALHLSPAQRGGLPAIHRMLTQGSTAAGRSRSGARPSGNPQGGDRRSHSAPRASYREDTVPEAPASDRAARPSARPEPATAPHGQQAGRAANRTPRRRRILPLAVGGAVLAAVAAAGVLQPWSPPAASEASAAAPATPDNAAAAPSPAAPPPPESYDFAGTCTWDQRIQTYENAYPGPALYAANCGTGGRLTARAVITEDDDYFMSMKYVLSGDIDGVPFELEGQVPAYDFETDESRGLQLWKGDFGGAPVDIWLERDGNGWVVQPASYIGDSLLEAWGPQAVINHEARGPDDALLWDDPSTVTGRYYGDERLTSDQVAALVNLLTVGTPASGINYLFV